ncbi:MAG: hypothetical protein KDE27_03200 [Planctomycetes bacterium]|nr:hypothetical protein [Planctomycetota bacterium]
MISTAARFLAGLALAASVTCFAAAQTQVAWALVDPAGHGATFVPNSNYQFTPAGPLVTVQRVAGTANRFVVKFPGIGGATGNFQASGYDGNHVAVINGWYAVGADVMCQVELFEADGSPANDKKFTIFYRMEGELDDRSAYLWANDPSAVSYTPDVFYSWNGNRANPWINRSGTGYYYVYLYGLANNQPERGNVQVTAYGTEFRRCWVQDLGHWLTPGHVLVLVRTFDAAGNPADARFTLHYNETAAPIAATLGSGAHMRSDNGTATCQVPDPLYRDSNGDVGPRDSESILRLHTGFYIARLPDVKPSDSAIPIVTAYGASTPIYASIEGFGDDGCGGTGVQVATWDAAGNPADARFSLLYLTDRPVYAREQAWAWINPFNAGAQFLTDGFTSYSTKTPPGSNTVFVVDRVGSQQNRYEIRLPGLAPDEGVPIVSSMAAIAPECAVIRGWRKDVDDVLVDIEVFDGNGGPAVDGTCTVLYRRGGAPTDREAYLQADQPSAASHTPLIWWNGNRGAPTVTRLGIGYYQVDLPGLVPLGSEGGHVQVSPVADQLVRATVVGWVPSLLGMRVTVRCYDAAGNAKDSKFTLMYHETAAPMDPRVGSGAHLWANLPTATGPYAPNATYRDSNGRFGPPDSETVTRLSTGHYEVTLPNLPGYATVVTAQVSSYGTNGFATLGSFGAPNPTAPTKVRVRTFDQTGAPQDGYFDLLYLCKASSLLLADTLSTGSGCNGATLTGLTKPALCHTWDMCLDGLPPGGVLGFVQLGLSNPNLSFGSQAPGCRQFTDALVTVPFPLPGFIPTYGLAIPADPSFVGLSIFAQGGALVPGINPLGLAASNGLIAQVGYN